MGERTAADWTIDPETGRTNASAEFRRLTEEVNRLLRDGAGGAVLHESWTSRTAALIVAQLAHVHHLAPEARTCYCGTTATVVPGTFPHDDCDGSVPASTASVRMVRERDRYRDWLDEATRTMLNLGTRPAEVNLAHRLRKDAGLAP